MSFLGDGVLRHLREVVDLPDLTGTKYRLLGRLGRGGMGAVHRVEDRELGREAALKVLGVPDDAGELSARLLAEARLIARLEHPNIIPIHDAGTLADGRVFYVMKLVRGTRLDEWMRQPAPRTARLRVFQRICEAVAFAHARGIVHRDLKPENVMIGPFGEALVMDWGVAKILGAPRGLPPPAEGAAPGAASDEEAPTLDARRDAHAPTGHGAVIGTPAYMAPEQARGEIDRIDQRTDVYALGALLYFLLCGRPPFEGESMAAVLRSVAEGPAPTPRAADPGVPRALDAVCAKAMSALPAARYASAEEMSRDVDGYLDGQPIIAYPENALDRVVRFAVKNRALVLLVLAYLVMRVLVLILAGR
ncbi:MAG: serine/threonine protein kinase [Acidobacteria bacterium]|nr:serine/threonine protein kinase [Acidobacteriota bacterium]